MGAAGGEAMGGTGHGGAAEGGAHEGGSEQGGTQERGGTGGGPEGGADPGTGGGRPRDSFELNDVSILFPKNANAEGMYAASDMAEHGALLPLSAFSKVGPIASIGSTTGTGGTMPEPVEDTYPQLRVVSARIDPCFPSLAAASCRHQVRLVMQPLRDNLFEDAALHVFYDLPPEDFQALLSDIQRLKRESQTESSGPLRVHPILSDEGPGGPFARGLRAALFAQIGADRLTRVTAMHFDGLNFVWTFRGFDFADGVAHPISILGTSDQQQSFHDFSSTGFAATVMPVFEADAPLEPAWSSADLRDAGRNVQQSAYSAALKLENPTIVDVESASCVACHTAGSVRLWSEAELGFSSTDDANHFESIFDLSLAVSDTVPPGPDRLRAFGYKGDDAIWSQRTINDSAAVAEYLSR